MGRGEEESGPEQGVKAIPPHSELLLNAWKIILFKNVPVYLQKRVILFWQQ
jgi:hypothetical protein